MYIRHVFLNLFLGEIILKLCDIMATHQGKARARMESL